MLKDHWGEPIPRREWTFSLAAMFRTVTAVAAALGWWMLLGTGPLTAFAILLGCSVAVASVAAARQQGGLGRQMLTAFGFCCGLLLVGGFIAGLRSVIVAATHGTENTEYFAAFFGCYLIVAMPVVFLASWLMLRAWLHLAADSREAKTK